MCCSRHQRQPGYEDQSLGRADTGRSLAGTEKDSIHLRRVPGGNRKRWRMRRADRRRRPQSLADSILEMSHTGESRMVENRKVSRKVMNMAAQRSLENILMRSSVKHAHAVRDEDGRGFDKQ